MQLPILSILIALPLVFAVLAGVRPERSAKTLGRLGGWLTFLASLALFALPAIYNAGVFTFAERYDWLPSLGVSYKVGVDGFSLWLVVLTTFLTALAIESAQTKIQTGTRAFYALMLWMSSALIGAFVSLDLLLFYVCFEAVLIPAYFLIGMFGGANRSQAGLKFILYTLVGSLLMLVSLIALYLHAGNTFDYTQILKAVTDKPMPVGLAAVAFGGFALAFAIKTPLFPFHTWLPDTYAEAPAPVTIILAGAMGKLGVYGFYRFMLPLFPELSRQAAPAFVWLGVAAIIYGALIASVQKDVKRVLAYSSVSHLGFIIMGLFSGTPQGVSGALIQTVNHGVITGALFLIAGIIEERRGTTRIAALGGLWTQMPVFGRFFLVVTFASVALPLTNGFVGEFLILLGTFQTHPIAACLATTGVIWSAVYMLTLFQKVMYGAVTKAENRRLRDLSGAEVLQLAPFVLAIFVLGIAPTQFSRLADTSTVATVNRLQPTPTGSGLVKQVSPAIPAITPPLTKPAPSVPTEESPLTPLGGSENPSGLPMERAAPTEAPATETPITP